MHVTGDQGPLAVSIGLQDAAPLTSGLLAPLACKDETWISGNIEAALFWHRAWWLSLPDPRSVAPAGGFSLGPHGVFTLSHWAPTGLALSSPFPLL